MEDGQKVTQKCFGEYKVITPEQQYLGAILSFFYASKMAVAIAFFCVNAVEAIQISCISMILSLIGFYIIYAKNTIATAILNA